MPVVSVNLPFRLKVGTSPQKNVWCAGGGLTGKGLRGLLAPCQRSMMVTVDGDERVADRPHASVLKDIDRRC